MASQISNLYVDQFSKDLQMISQQKKSRLFDTIMGSNKYDVQAENFSHDFIGKSADFVENTDFYGSSVETNTPFYRRWGLTTPFEWGEMVSQREVNRIGKDPKSKILESASASLGRKIDDVIIEALNADSVKQGAKQATATDVNWVDIGGVGVDENTLSVLLGSGNPMYGGTGTDDTAIGLTLDKLRKATLLFNKNEVDPSLKRYLVVSSEELDFLADSVDIRSKDYEMIQSIINNTSKEGISYMGFEWRILERLPVRAYTIAGGDDFDGNARTCFAYTEQALAFGEQGNTEVDTEKRADRKFNWYTQITKDIGAFRAEDIHAVRIPCVTTSAVNTLG